MPKNLLADLLRKRPSLRTAEDYERVHDDFVSFAGGARLTDRFEVPVGCKNVDYYFEGDGWELLLELKQVRAFRPSRTVEQYFEQLIAAGRVRQVEHLGSGRVRITPQSLTRREWNLFYKNFCPTVSDALKKAARQLKATAEFLPPSLKRRIGGVILINSGNFNVSNELMLRFVEWRMKREWKGGHYQAIDFVRCHAMDMIHDQQNPLQGRQIARSAADALVVSVVRHLYDRWLHYGAAAVGAKVEFIEGECEPEVKADVSRRFQGKIQFVGPPGS